jgi:K+-transporting ATPase ATPase C chain
MLITFYRSVVATLLLALILCGAYPLTVYGIGRLLFSDQVSGGIIVQDGKAVGAKLIGQGFSKPWYFHGRPSAAGEKGYDAANSSGTNLGPTNQKFHDALQANVEAALRDNPSLKKGEIPGDLVTASASGLDPHISPESALVQVARVASVRHVSVEQLNRLVQRHTEGPQCGIFGESVVNVLLLNMDLDQIAPLSKSN